MPPPTSRLGGNWRSRIPEQLARLAEAWRDPAAWTGMTQAGRIDLPGDVAGRVALNELVIHGRDVARASNQDFTVDPRSLEASMDFAAAMSVPAKRRLGKACSVPSSRFPLMHRSSTGSSGSPVATPDGSRAEG